MAHPGGRPPWIPDQEMIETAQSLYGQGMTLEQIADYFGISYQTLNERRKEIPEFAEAFKKGKGKANAFVTGKLFEQIQGNNLTAIIFYLKCQMNWKESSGLELSGKDGKPIQTESKQMKDAAEHLQQIMVDVVGKTEHKEKANDEVSRELNN